MFYLSIPSAWPKPLALYLLQLLTKCSRSYLTCKIPFLQKQSSLCPCRIHTNHLNLMVGPFADT